jgi:hypothetical protein
MMRPSPWLGDPPCGKARALRMRAGSRNEGPTARPAGHLKQKPRRSGASCWDLAWSAWVPQGVPCDFFARPPVGLQCLSDPTDVLVRCSCDGREDRA